jgi:RNA polymerase sigma factor (sigma-70 family)
MTRLDQADKFLLDQIRRGNGDAWTQLLDRYQGRLLTFARGKLGSAADADDIVQDTFISFLKSLPNFREQASLETYLFAICRRKILNVYRGRKVSVCLLQDLNAGSDDNSRDAVDEMMAPEQTASWYARRDEAHEQDRAALSAALSEVVDHLKNTRNFRDLKIIEMLFYCQLRNKEVASVAEVSANHVALVKHRSIKQIQASLTHAVKRAASTTSETFELPDALLSQIWQEDRLSCLKRSTIGAYLLGTLEAPWSQYVGFHLDRLGCAFCRANYEDLREKTKDDRQPEQLRQRILESTVGFLKKV